MDPQILLSAAKFLILAVLLLVGANLYLVFRLKDLDPFAKWNANKINAYLLLAFMVGGVILSVWSSAAWYDTYALVTDPASEHGADIDSMFWMTTAVVMIVYISTNILLFYFAFTYRKTNHAKAHYYPHNDRLEYIWTAVPAIVLTILVLRGVIVWTNVMEPAPEDALNVELNGYQFGWTVRYPGADGEYGETRVQYIDEGASNQLGFEVSYEVTDEVIATLKQENVPDSIISAVSQLKGEVIKPRTEFLKRIGKATIALSKEGLVDMNIHQRDDLNRYKSLVVDNSIKDLVDAKGHDDFIADTIHLPVGKPVLLTIKSRDVLHSATLPHFRVKMDAVPGMPTKFWFTPSKTTAEMRQIKENPEFNYELSCQEVCGPGHFNMRRVIIVEDQGTYAEWEKAQQPFYALWKQLNLPTIADATEAPTEEGEEAVEGEEGEAEATEGDEMENPAEADEDGGISMNN